MTTAGTLLGETLEIFGRGWKTYVPIAIVIQLPFLLVGAFAFFLPAESGIPVSTISDIVSAVAAGPLVTGAIAFAVFQSYRQRHADIGASIRYGLSRLLPLIGVTILVTLATMGGFLLFIVPGFIAMIGLFVAVPVLMLEETGIRAALSRSWHLTKGFRISIFGFVFVLGLLGSVIVFAIGFAVAIVLGFASIADWQTELVVGLFLGPPMAALQAIGATVAYRELRKEKEGVADDELAAIFD